MRRVAKLINTIRICSGLFMARTFGSYVHSGWDLHREKNLDYHIYNWRGREYFIPAGPLGEEH